MGASAHECSALPPSLPLRYTTSVKDLSNHLQGEQQSHQSQPKQEHLAVHRHKAGNYKGNLRLCRVRCNRQKGLLTESKGSTGLGCGAGLRNC